ncbi:hypothetical protein SAMN06272765_8688 [Streptomyces sp. Ag109_G2-15]|nr:hypothetical protein SAMN06272765_8688 [Streptomyces sp. Ag109_G2-15]
MSEITYVRGDATVPSVKGAKVIAHVCNDIGGWGKGFVLGAVQNLSSYGRGSALKGRGELRDQPRTFCRHQLAGRPTTQGTRPTSGAACDW